MSEPTNTKAKVLIRALMFTLRNFKPDGAKVGQSVAANIITEAGGCPVLIMEAIDLLQEVIDELTAEARGHATSVFPLNRASTARHENWD